MNFFKEFKVARVISVAQDKVIDDFLTSLSSIDI